MLLGIDRHNVVARDVLRVDPRDRGEIGEDVMFATLCKSRDRLEVLLGIEREPIAIHSAVQMDRQLRNPQVRSRVHENFLAVHENDATGKFEVAVEKRIKQRTAIDFDANLVEAVRSDRALGLELQRW